MTKAIRWTGDNDHYWGPFTYARERSDYRPVTIMLGSGDGDDYPGCRLRLSAFGRTLILALPPIIKPWREWVTITTEPTRSQMIAANRLPGYVNQHEREYGISFTEGGYVSVHYGRQTHDSSTTDSWGWFMPWKEWRHVRHSWYGLSGEHIADMPQQRVLLGAGDWKARHAEEERIEAAVPVVTLAFEDCDGERLTAATRINEREWRRGVRWWRWLSLIWPKHVDRSLDIRFSGETGKRKGSWKGGTMGHSIGMRPGELHEAAFRRYCIEHDMKFIGL